MLTITTDGMSIAKWGKLPKGTQRIKSMSVLYSQRCEQMGVAYYVYTVIETKYASKEVKMS